jgi:hypothetical protein
LVYIFGKNSLKNDESLVAFSRFNHAQIVHLSIPIEIQVAECTIRVVEHRLELLQVLSLCEQFSYNLQIESFRDVRTVGGNGDRLFRP